MGTNAKINAKKSRTRMDAASFMYHILLIDSNLVTQRDAEN